MSNWRLFRAWHRWLGIGIAGFVLVLTVTGIMLNHSQSLGLDDLELEPDWLLGWYGIEGLSRDALAFRVDDQWIISNDGWLYLDDRPMATGSAPAVGAVKTEQMIIVASAREILLFTPEGDLVEQYVPTDFATDISKLGLAGGGPVVETGDHVFQADENISQWHPFAGEAAWSESLRIPDQFISSINGHLRGGGLPLSRVLLDIHSGRFWGALGPVVMDAVALILIVLNVIGIWLWCARR